MTHTKSTPGPWSWWVPDDSKYVLPELRGPEGELVLSLGGGGRFTEDGIAGIPPHDRDAVLIEAAPVLLDTLNRVYDMLLRDEDRIEIMWIINTLIEQIYESR